MTLFPEQVYSRMCHPIENANTIAKSDETAWGLPHVCLAAQPHTVPSSSSLGLRFSSLAWPLAFFGHLQSPSRNQIRTALFGPMWDHLAIQQRPKRPRQRPDRDPTLP